MTKNKSNLLPKIENVKKLVIVLFFSCFFISGSGQFLQSALLDAGSSTTTSNGFFRIASASEYRLNNFHGGTGFQWTFSGSDRKRLSGWFLTGGGDLYLRDIPVTADLFFRVNPLTSLTRETNFGFLLAHMRSHVEIHAGYHMRYYSLSRGQDVTNDLPEGADVTIWEYRNFLYRGTLLLNKPESEWNVSFSVTNFDHFLIQQETNPFLNISGLYRFSNVMKIFSEFWMQNAGMLNLHPNFYGFYFRAGIEWQFGR